MDAHSTPVLSISIDIDSGTQIPSDLSLLKKFLLHRDVFCPRCGFNLRNGIAARCAECGCVVELQVTDRSPPTFAFALMIAAVSLPLGVIVPLWGDLLSLAYKDVYHPYITTDTFNRYDWYALGLATGMILLSIFLIGILVCARRKIAGLSAWKRWLLLVIAIAAGAVAHFESIHELREIGTMAINADFDR